ncbi:MAG: hypothetical protein BIFFINMI_01298 [Phycisphaerae bacterium]|nr:hypothetical protein [Phycisphaerae bacterium]
MTSLPTTTTAQVPVAGRALPPGARVGMQPASGGLNFRQVIAILQRHVWLILATFLIVVVVAGAAYVLCLMFGKEYTARGTMRLSDVGRVSSDLLNPAMDKFKVETRQREQATRVASEAILTELLQDPDADNWIWVREHKNDSDPMIVQLLKRISANPVRDSTTIMVSMEDPDREAAAQIVNKLMEFYVRRTSGESGRVISDAMRALDQTLAGLYSKRQGIVDQLKELESSRNYDDISRTSSEVVGRVQSLDRMLVEAGLTRDRIARAAKQAEETYKDPNAPLPPDLEAQYNADLNILNLQRQYDALRVQRSILISRGLGPDHSDVKSVDIQADEAFTKLSTQQAALRGQLRQVALDQVRGAKAAADQQYEDIQSKLTDARDQKRQLVAMTASHDRLVRDRADVQDSIDRLERRKEELQVEERHARAPLEIFSSASAPRPEDYTFPRLTLFLAGAVVLGLGLAVGLAFLLELSNTTIRTPRDISEHVRMPLLGFVPQLEGGDAPLSAASRIVADQPLSMMAESFRQIRTNLLFSAPADQLGTVAITSAAREEGKTTVAGNLAITVALSGRAVLMIDANFRRPDLSGAFAPDAQAGLSNVLTSQATLEDSVRETGIPNLSVLPTGPVPPDPAELLGSSNMRALLDQAALKYDLVLIDAPPALLLTDSLVLATMVDGVIAVIRAGASSRGMVSRLRDQLTKVNGRVVGAVLNAARATRGGYFRKTQQQYEEYHVPGQLPR